MSVGKQALDSRQCGKDAVYSFMVFLVVKGPAADATDALQPWGLLCNPVMKTKMMIIVVLFLVMEHGGMKLTGENRSTRRKTCPSATLSTTNSTWTDPGSNPGFRGGRSAANRLSHGRPILWFYVLVCSKMKLFNSPHCVESQLHKAKLSAVLARYDVHVAGLVISCSKGTRPAPGIFHSGAGGGGWP
jgi:hypothetical protein